MFVLEFFNTFEARTPLPFVDEDESLSFVAGLLKAARRMTGVAFELVLLVFESSLDEVVNDGPDDLMMPFSVPLLVLFILDINEATGVLDELLTTGGALVGVVAGAGAGLAAGALNSLLEGVEALEEASAEPLAKYFFCRAGFRATLTASALAPESHSFLATPGSHTL